MSKIKVFSATVLDEHLMKIIYTRSLISGSASAQVRTSLPPPGGRCLILQQRLEKREISTMVLIMNTLVFILL